jgi:hypothetical protein
VVQEIASSGVSSICTTRSDALRSEVDVAYAQTTAVSMKAAS